MKKLIKSGVCETYEQCIYALFTKDRSTVAAEEKKKKRKRRRNTFKCYPNIHIGSLLGERYLMHWTHETFVSFIGRSDRCGAHPVSETKGVCTWCIQNFFPFQRERQMDLLLLNHLRKQNIGISSMQRDRVAVILQVRLP